MISGKSNSRSRSASLRIMTVAGMFTALAFLVTVVFHIKVSFLAFEFKDAIITVGAMICGPLYSVPMAVITALIERFTISDTGEYGLIMNIIASVAFTLPASLIYKFKRTLKGALAGLVTAVFTMTGVMLLANLVITPFYMGVDIRSVADMIPSLLLPFNLTKATLNAGVVFLLYKPLIKALRKARLIKDNGSKEQSGGRKSTIIMLALALTMIIASIIVYFIVLRAVPAFGSAA